MRFGFLIFLLIPFIGHLYIFWHIWQLLPLNSLLKGGIVALLLLAFLSIFFIFGSQLDKMPIPIASGIYEIGTTWLIVFLYLTLIFWVLDLGRLFRLIPSTMLHSNAMLSVGIPMMLLGLMIYGNFRYKHKYRQSVELTTSKHLTKDYKLIMISDLHLGYHNRKAEFQRWVRLINEENPDLVLIGGDVIDRSIRPLIEENMAEDFKHIKAPIYACFGNHEYFSGLKSAQDFYRTAQINLLSDSAVVWKNELMIVGRKDRSDNHRKPLSEIFQGKAPSDWYSIVLDHQPYQLEEAESNQVDFQFSGHTHRGQVWPISWITDRIYECSHGYLQRGNTHYYVSSGLGIWGAKIRIGTRSEYVVCTIRSMKD